MKDHNKILLELSVEILANQSMLKDMLMKILAGDDPAKLDELQQATIKTLLKREAFIKDEIMKKYGLEIE